MAMPLKQVAALLEALAPPNLAEEWDNVGLLVEPSTLAGDRPARLIERVLMTIDFTEGVLREAVEQRSDLVVSYHPPIFRGLLRLRAHEPAERAVLGAIEHGIAIYSPHTALDAAAGGMNDWLLEAFASGEPGFIQPLPGSDAGAGLGRRLILDEAEPLSRLVERIKSHLQLTQCRVAAAPEHALGRPLRSIAVCAGAGGSLFAKLDDVDLYLTGEMRHHDVLAKLTRGASVVLCDHTNTERGYLPRLAERLRVSAQAALVVRVSEVDRDPLAIV
jgi:dinuclear metal center YbgI/SA1388 family protein